MWLGRDELDGARSEAYRTGGARRHRPSGSDGHHAAAVTSGPTDDHPVVQSRDGRAARMDKETRDHCMDETCQSGCQQGKAETEGMALMLEIRFTHGTRVLHE